MRFKEFEVINEIGMFDIAKLLGMPDEPESVEKTAEPIKKSILGVDKKSTSDDKTAPVDVDTSTAKSGKMPVNASAISKYLTAKGLDDTHRLGMLANIKAESNFNSGAIGDKGTSGGLFQHHADRFKKMINAAGPNWQKNWQGQINYALSEPAGREYLATQFKSPEAATEWWTRKFEVPANVNQQVAARVNALRNFV